MSYTIVKHIKVKDNKVFINGACNNVTPRDYGYYHCESLSKILNEQGREALDIEILKAYEEGNLQRGNNKYTSALKRLRHMDEYKKFDWRNTGEGYEFANNIRRTNSFKRILGMALKSKNPTDRFILNKRNVYLFKLTKNYAKWTPYKSEAKEFYYREELENIKMNFTTGNDWNIIKIK